MKKLYFLLSVVLGLTACNTEDILPVDRAVAPGSAEANVTFTLEVPDNDVFASTRSALFGPKSNSANGGLTNVDFTKYDLRYKLAIYRVDGPTSTVVAIPPITQTFDTYQGTTYSLSLTPNRDYKVVVWADFVTEDTKDDLHYNTTNFENITVANPTAVAILNDESRDAYRVVESFHFGDAPLTKNLVLTRPFAKVRFVATDWGLSTLEKPTNVKVTYYGCERFSGLNLLTGETQTTTLADKTDLTLPVYTGTVDRDTKEYALGYDGDAPNNRTLFVDYLMTKNQTETPIHLTIEALDGTKSLAKHDVQTNVPIKTNWLTTILGRALTKEAVFTVSVEEYFVNNWIVNERWWRNQNLTPTKPSFDAGTKTYSVGTREELMWIASHPEEFPTGAAYRPYKKVVITSDIDMSGVEWMPIAGGMHFDGQNHKLRNFSLNGEYLKKHLVKGFGKEVEAFIGVFGRMSGSMKNVTFENISLNGLSDATTNTNTKTGVPSNDQLPVYFGGCVAKAFRFTMENVHAKHVHIKAGANAISQNVGGLVGDLTAPSSLKNCSAKDIHVVMTSDLFSQDTGGLIGQSTGANSFTNCVVDYVTIRMGKVGLTTSGFIGRLTKEQSTIQNCPAPTNVFYINHKTGRPMEHTPTNPYYGQAENAPTITP